MSRWLSKQMVLCEPETFPFACIIERQGLCITVDLQDVQDRKEQVFIEFTEMTPFCEPLYICLGCPPLFVNFEGFEEDKVYARFIKIKDWFPGSTLKDLICNIFCIWQESLSINNKKIN